MANLPRLHMMDEHDTERDALAPLKFERRAGDRAPAGGSMQAVIASGVDMPLLLRLQLIDASATGLGAVVPSPIDIGSRLSIRVDPVHGAWKTGSVVRCVPCEGGYRLGVLYSQRKAA